MNVRVPIPVHVSDATGEGEDVGIGAPEYRKILDEVIREGGGGLAMLWSWRVLVIANR